jgi:hypothetical protein
MFLFERNCMSFVLRQHLFLEQVGEGVWRAYLDEHPSFSWEANTKLAAIEKARAHLEFMYFGHRDVKSITIN